VQRYFFHIQHSHLERDQVGSEHKDFATAKCHAVKMIAEVLCETPQSFWDSDTYRVTVTDGTALVLFTVEMISVMAAAAPGCRV
jgi:hypothetical protein